MGLYSGDMAWGDWSTLLSSRGEGVDNTLETGLNAYWKWYDYSYSKTNSDIAVALGKTVADITAMQNGFGAIKKMYDVFNGRDTVVVSLDYSGYMRPF